MALHSMVPAAVLTLCIVIPYHLRHPVDDDYMVVGRGDVWGIPKPETLEWLATLYPALVEKAALQAETAADEELCR